MEPQLLNAYYQMIRLARQTRLDDGKCILGLWKTGDKLAVCPLSVVSDERTIEYCHWIEDLSRTHNFYDEIHIEPLGWQPGEGDPKQWIQDHHPETGFSIEWTFSGVSVRTGSGQSIIRDKW
jgi:hypothetical protein